MAHTVFIDGAAGTTGLEIADRLAGRSEFELVVLEGDKRKDPAARADALNASDFAILCLPDDAAREAVALIDPGSKVRVIDASTAHRVTPGWVYGFPEIIGYDEVANATRVSNPGCYPTGFIALMAPLTATIQPIKSLDNPVPVGNPTTILPADWVYTVNAVSGYSGGGKALIERFEADSEIAFRAYGLDMGHKHIPEMQKYAGLRHQPIFAPSVIPAFRGMLVDIPIPLAAMGLEHPFALWSELDMWYEESWLVRVRDYNAKPTELLIRKDDEPWDGMDLYVFVNEDGSQARLVAVLDNLGKGASGAAVQSLNLMAGLDETAGLRL